MSNDLNKLDLVNKVHIFNLIGCQQSIIDDEKQYNAVNEIEFCDGLNDVISEWFPFFDIDIRGHIKDYIIENLKF